MVKLFVDGWQRDYRSPTVRGHAGCMRRTLASGLTPAHQPGLAFLTLG